MLQKFILKNFIEIDLNKLYNKKKLTLFLLSNLLNKIVDDKIFDFVYHNLFEFTIDFDQYIYVKNRLIREKIILIDFSIFVEIVKSKLLFYVKYSIKYIRCQIVNRRQLSDKCQCYYICHI